MSSPALSSQFLTMREGFTSSSFAAFLYGFRTLSQRQKGRKSNTLSQRSSLERERKAFHESPRDSGMEAIDDVADLSSGGNENSEKKNY